MGSVFLLDDEIKIRRNNSIESNNRASLQYSRSCALAKHSDSELGIEPRVLVYLFCTELCMCCSDEVSTQTKRQDTVLVKLYYFSGR